MNEKEMNLTIYNKLADIAREVFNHLTAEPGRVYTPADIARAITGGPVVREVDKTQYICDRVEKYEIGEGLTWAEGYDPATVYEVAEGSFSCRVNGWKIFDVLDRCARAWSIATADRVKFTAERAAAPVVASFTLTAAEGRELLACCADDVLRPVMGAVHLDTRRRVLVASDGHIMRVINLGDRLTITDTAAPYYNIHKSVIKAGRAVTITADSYATAAGVSVACLADMYPNWAMVLDGTKYSEAGRVALTPATWRELKKAVAEVSKVLYNCKYHPLRVTIAHTQGESVLHIYARDIDFNRERETAVAIDPAAPSFSVDTDARRWAKMTTPAAALYVAETCRAIIATDPAGLTMVMPLQPMEGDKYYMPFTIAPAGQTLDPLPGVDIAAAAADITAARHISAAVAILEENDAAETPATPAALADRLVNLLGHTIDTDRAAEILTAARELMTAAAEMTARETITPAPAADSIESEPTPAETIESQTAEPTPAAPAAADIEADPLPLLTIDTAAGVIVWGLADELPTADGLTADTVTPADLLTIEAEHAESERERADRAALLTIATADSQTADTDRAERRPLLLTIARHALRLAAAALLLLLLTIAPDRAADTLAAPADLTATPAAADLLTIAPDRAADTLAAAAPAADSIEAETITAADLLTADSEAESRAELADPADSPRPAPANKRESHARALLTIATADSIAAPAADSIEAAPLLTIEADTLTADTLTAAPLLLTADSIEADTLAAQVATLEQAREITAPADTLAAGSTLQAVGEITDTPTADTDSEADTITPDEPTDDTDPAAADSESDTDTQTDTATNGHPHAHGSTPATMAAPCSTSAPLAPVAPILI